MTTDAMVERGRQLRAEAKAAQDRSWELRFQSRMLRTQWALHRGGLEGLRDTMRIALSLQGAIVQATREPA